MNGVTFNQHSNNSMSRRLDRKSFIRSVAVAGIGLGMLGRYGLQAKSFAPITGKRIGIIGLDTSHSEVFCRMINEMGAEGLGYRVTVAYHPASNRDVLNLVPSVSKALTDAGVTLVNSMDALLDACDVVLLETIDGGPHLEQVLPVFEAKKRVFIDKPLAASLPGARAIASASERYGTPFFSSSSLRFDPNVQQVMQGSVGKVNGADVYTPAELEESHLDMAWYAIHGLEMLYAVLGPGCQQVSRIYTPEADVVTGVWTDGRIGTVRGVRKWPVGIAGTAFGEKGTAPLGPFSDQAYRGLVTQIVQFFDTGIAPVKPADTLEMFAFMEAADRSRKRNGKAVALDV